MRNSRADLERTEVRRPSSKTIGHIGQGHASVHRSRSRLQSEIELVRFIQLLESRYVFGVEAPYVHKNVVVNQKAVAILFRCLTVLRKSRILARFKVRTKPRSQWIHGDIRGRRVPTKRNRRSWIWPEAVV